MNPNKIRTVVAEDEKNARAEILFLLQKCPEVEVVGEAKNGMEALALVRRLQPDLLILDVQMPGRTGLQVVEELRAEGGKLPGFIFLTAYSHFAVEAFNLEAVDYVLKPVEEERLLESIRRLSQRIRVAPPLPEEGPDQISLKRGNRIFLVRLSEVAYFQVEGGLIVAEVGGQRGLVAYSSLDELEQKLAGRSFFRCHRRYLVNLDWIAEVIPLLGGVCQLQLKDAAASKLPLSRSQARELRKRIRF